MPESHSGDPDDTVTAAAIGIDICNLKCSKKRDVKDTKKNSSDYGRKVLRNVVRVNELKEVNMDNALDSKSIFPRECGFGSLLRHSVTPDFPLA